MLDVKIVNGDLLDGTGRDPVAADVGIRGDTVVETGRLSGAPARIVVDARGRIVCPGFIDVHSHSDVHLLIRPSADSKIFQGVTTEVVGNCGASAAPAASRRVLPSDWQNFEFPGTWSSVAEYRRLLESVRPAPNVVLLAGHNTLRRSIVGSAHRPATADERRALVRSLEQAMDEGARGVSTGLLYAPGRFAEPGEVRDLAAAAAARGGIYTSHVRNEGAGLLASIDEALDVARRTGIRAEISHLKTSGRPNWGLLDEALERIRAARAAGLEVAADRYPYTASCTDLDVLLPDWAGDGGREATLARLRESDTRARIRSEILAARSPEYWPTVIVASTAHEANRRHRGRALCDVAADMGCEPVDAALALMESDELRTSAFFTGMSEENMRRILREPYVMLGSDASLRALDGPASLDYPHPRAYGAFPRFLRMALDEGLVTPAEAVRKMTSLPADHFRLPGRGVVSPGARADVIVFDAASVRDASTYASPHRMAVGIDHVFVNGVWTLRGGRLTGERGGRIL